MSESYKGSSDKLVTSQYLFNQLTSFYNNTINNTTPTFRRIEYGNFGLSSNYTLTGEVDKAQINELVPFDNLLNSQGNLLLSNGLVALKKDSTYLISVILKGNDNNSSTENGTLVYYIRDSQGNQLSPLGYYSSSAVSKGLIPILCTITPLENIEIGVYVLLRSNRITQVLGGIDNTSFVITEISNVQTTNSQIKSIVTNGVEDVLYHDAVDEITITNTDKSNVVVESDMCSYAVFNGICYVSIANIGIGMVGSECLKITGLPKPAIDVNVPLHNQGEYVGSISYLYDTTEVIVSKTSPTTGFTSFNYPINAS